MNKKDKNLIIKGFESVIQEVERNIDSKYNFLCRIISNLPNAKLILKYFESQKPRMRVNKDFMNFKLYTGSFAWWVYSRNTMTYIELNKEKIRFLKHLIKKLG